MSEIDTNQILDIFSGIAAVISIVIVSALTFVLGRYVFPRCKGGR